MGFVWWGVGGENPIIGHMTDQMRCDRVKGRRNTAALIDVWLLLWYQVLKCMYGFPELLIGTRWYGVSSELKSK